MTDTLSTGDEAFMASAPGVRDDALIRRYGNEIVAWSPTAALPAYLDPVAALVFQLLDGTSSVGALVDDVHDVVGVPTGVAREQIRRVVDRLDARGLLTTSNAPVGDADPDDLGIFLGPPNP